MKDNGGTDSGFSEEIKELRRRIAELEAEQAEFRELVARQTADLERYRGLLECLPQSVFEIDLDGRFLYLNRHALEVSGYTPDDLQDGRSLFDLLPPDQHAAVRANMARSLLERTLSPNDYTICLKNGAPRPITAYALPFFRDGRPAGFRGLSLDIRQLKSAKEELKRLVAVIEATSDIVSTSEKDGTITYMNQAGRKMFGWENEESLSKYHRQDVQPAWVREKRGNEVLSCLDKFGIWSGEMAVIDRNGQEVPVSQVIIEHTSPSGAVDYYSTIVRDITLRKQIEQALRDSEARYRDTLDALGDSVHVMNTDFEIVLCNQRFDAWQKELGLETIRPGQNLFETLPFLGDRVRQEYEYVLRTGQILPTEETTRIGGVDIHTETRKFPVFDGGRITGVATVVRDITDRREAQRALRDAQANLEEKVRVRTEELAETNRRLQEEIEVRAGTELQLRSQEELLQIERDLALALGQAADMPELLELLLTAALRLDDIDLGGVYLLDPDTGDLNLVVHHNLSEAFVQAASHFGPDSPQAAAARADRTLYLSKNEIPAKDPSRVLAEATSLAVLPVQYQGESIACLNVASKTLEQFPAATRRALETIAAHIGEVVERMRALERLRESEENFRRTFEDSSDAILWIDTSSGRVMNANHAAEALLERPRGEIIGQHYLTLNDRWDRAEAERFFRACAEQGTRFEREIHFAGQHREPSCVNVVVNTIHLRGHRILHAVLRDVTQIKLLEVERARLFTAVEQSDEIVVITDKEGTIVYVNPAFETVTQYTREEAIGKRPSLLKSGKQDAQFYKNLWETILGGNTWRGHLINRRKDGRLYEEDVIISPVVNRLGVVDHFVAMKNDVTEHAELQRQLRQAQRIESLGAIASGMAHDFKNFLTLISGYSEIASKLVDGDARAVSCIQQIASTTERAAVMVNRVLAFGQTSEQEVRPVALGKLLEEALDMVRPSFPKAVALRTHIGEGRHTILADPARIHQVIVNLCTNAVQAMAERGGVLEVDLETVEGAPSAPMDERAAGPGKYEQLRISDTGHGMDSETLERIFEPFFTTRKRKEGTGLGLAIAQRIIHNAGGTIEVQSTPGQGTSFLIRLPHSVADSRATEECDRARPQTTCRILFVDDEEDIGSMIQLGLEQLGFAVDVFTQSPGALEAFRAAPSSFDLLMTDYMMPDMNGLDLAKACLTLRPDLPVIVISGIEERMASEGGNHFDEWINKPVTPNLLAQAVKRVLAARVGAGTE